MNTFNVFYYELLKVLQQQSIMSIFQVLYLWASVTSLCAFLSPCTARNIHHLPEEWGENPVFSTDY